MAYGMTITLFVSHDAWTSAYVGADPFLVVQSFSSTESGVPHTCFEDTILIPLASWSFYAFLVIGVPISIRFLSHNTIPNKKVPLHRLIHRKSSSTKNLYFGRRPRTKTTLAFVYSILVVAILLMGESQ